MLAEFPLWIAMLIRCSKNDEDLGSPVAAISFLPKSFKNLEACIVRFIVILYLVVLYNLFAVLFSRVYRSYNDLFCMFMICLYMLVWSMGIFSIVNRKKRCF